MLRAGRCQCGKVRYECDDDIHELYVCHCTNCRKQSSSAFGISFVVPSENFRLTEGTPGYFEWKTGSGTVSKGAFCPACGTRLWHQSSGAEAAWISVKGGSLDNPVDLSDAVHIWISSKLPGVVVPEHARKYPQEPPVRKV